MGSLLEAEARGKIQGFENRGAHPHRYSPREGAFLFRLGIQHGAAFGCPGFGQAALQSRFAVRLLAPFLGQFVAPFWGSDSDPQNGATNWLKNGARMNLIFGPL